MNVTREIVKDLLPLYVSGEASPDSRALVEAFLREDPQLARLADALRAEELSPARGASVPSGAGRDAPALASASLAVACALWIAHARHRATVARNRAVARFARRRAGAIGYSSERWCAWWPQAF